MPVMQPDINAANRIGDEITNEVLKLMKDKYKVDSPDLRLPLGPKLAPQWEQLESQLRETIKEMVWNDHCACF